MPRGFFITGTDTGVGKTVTSAALLRRLRDEGPGRYWKPIQTGIEQDDDTADVARLAGARDEEIVREGIRLPKPVSPHLAARMAGQLITFAPLLEIFRRHDEGATWIVEGAGGVLVPINDAQLMADLIRLLSLPALVVSRTALGTINHTLMTIEALRHRDIPIAGLVMVGAPDPGVRETIARLGGVPIVGDIPRLEAVTPEAVAAAAGSLDPEGELTSRLGPV